MGVGSGWGGAPTHMHMHARMHACARTHMHARGKHDNFMQMAAPIGFWGNPWELPMMMSYMHVRVCVCMHMHACAHV